MNKFLTLGLIALLVFIIVQKIISNFSAKNKIRAMKQEQKSMFLVDVRQPSEYQSGSVEGAINIPLGQVQQRIGEFKNKENIVVFCLSGGRSAQAARILKQNRIENVVNGGTWRNVASALKNN